MTVFDSTRDQACIAKAFDLWMDDYAHHPESFAETEAIAAEHALERARGREPSYGTLAAAMLREYLGRALGAAGDGPATLEPEPGPPSTPHWRS